MNTDKLKRNLNIWMSEQESERKSWKTGKAPYDVHYYIAEAKAQAFQKVINCIERMESLENG